jgi:peptidoglycan/LPS O-acetylase OafA/YrhL
MTTPAILALVATLALGVAVGAVYLARARRPWLVTAHLSAALIAAALVLAVIQFGPPPREGAPHPAWPAGLLIGATAIGYAAWRLPRMTRRRAEALLGLHIVLGVAAFFVFLNWIKGMS